MIDECSIVFFIVPSLAVSLSPQENIRDVLSAGHFILFIREYDVGIPGNDNTSSSSSLVRLSPTYCIGLIFLQQSGKTWAG